MPVTPNEAIQKIVSLIECGRIKKEGDDYVYDGKLLGKGSYGSVYLTCIFEDSCYAVKLEGCKKKKRYNKTDVLRSEYYIQNVASGYGLAPRVYKTEECKSVGQCLTIMDRAKGKTLFEILQSSNDRRRAIKHVFEAIDNLHKKGIQHGDLNPSNIFYDRKTGKVQFIDFSMPMKGRKNRKDYETLLYYYSSQWKNMKNKDNVAYLCKKLIKKVYGKKIDCDYKGAMKVFKDVYVQRTEEYQEYWKSIFPHVSPDYPDFEEFKGFVQKFKPTT